jgi:glycerol-3-phosphate dehydrogenase
MSIEDIKGSTNAVAEGVFTALAIHQMAERLNVDMPICEQVYQVIYEKRPIKEALASLQARPLRAEHD